MRTVRVDKNREAEVPDTWVEGEKMITNALGAYYDRRGRNLARLSIAARVAHGMFGQQLMAGDPTLALLYLLQRICIRKGAGLDNLRPLFGRNAQRAVIPEGMAEVAGLSRYGRYAPEADLNRCAGKEGRRDHRACLRSRARRAI